MHFEITTEEWKQITEWRKPIDAARLKQQRSLKDPFITGLADDGVPYYGAIGGELTFGFTPTSIGVIKVVKHTDGAELDLTDFSSW